MDIVNAINDIIIEFSTDEMIDFIHRKGSGGDSKIHTFLDEHYHYSADSIDCFRRILDVEANQYRAKHWANEH